MTSDGGPIINTSLQRGGKRRDQDHPAVLTTSTIVDGSKYLPNAAIASPFGRGLGEGLTLEALLPVTLREKGDPKHDGVTPGPDSTP
jgi:hypothetical protein